MIPTLLRCAMLTSCATAYGWRTFRLASAVRTAFQTRPSVSSSALGSLPENRDELNVKTAENVPYDNFKFELVKQSDTSRARLGTVTTPHGIVSTPNFVFCATKAAMKAITPAQLWEAGSQIILSNTYHLMLTPGPEIIDQMGGLQKFTNWRGPMLTDSGGYQIFSMGYGSVSNEIKGKRDMGWDQTLIKIDEEGATFRSYVDGTIHHLTPELSVDIQRQLGADLIVVLDECTPFKVDKDYTASSMRRSHRWAIRSLKEFVRTTDGTQALYGIIQGGIYEDLRDESAAFINQHAFFGTAIGGSLGANKKDMHDIVAYTRARVRDDRPVHLLGIGGVRDIFHGVRHGIDTFDCVHPSRLARHGGALVMAHHWTEEPNDVEPVTPMTQAVEKKRLKLAEKNRQREAYLTANNGGVPVPKKIVPVVEEDFKSGGSGNSAKQMKSLKMVREHINLCKSRMRNDPRPIDSTCGCYTCTGYSRAYLHHLFKAKETLGGTLVTIHNVYFMNRLMKEIRFVGMSTLCSALPLHMFMFSVPKMNNNILPACSSTLREGIQSDTLDDVEAKFVHPNLVASVEGNDDIEVSDGIGS